MTYFTYLSGPVTRLEPPYNWRVPRAFTCLLIAGSMSRISIASSAIRRRLSWALAMILVFFYHKLTGKLFTVVMSRMSKGTALL